jgi:hypothetical protein
MGLAFEKAVIEFNGCVRSIAKRFVLGRPTTAARYVVPLFVALAVMRLDGDSSAHPVWSAASQRLRSISQTRLLRLCTLIAQRFELFHRSERSFWHILDVVPFCGTHA